MTEWDKLRVALSHSAVVPQSRLRPVWDVGDKLQEQVLFLQTTVKALADSKDKLEEENKQLKRKADLWDKYAIYDNDNEPLITVAKLLEEHEKLEAIRKLKDQIPEGFVDSAYYVNQRRHDEERVWDFEQWYIRFVEVLGDG